MNDHVTYYIDLHVHTLRYSPCAELLDPGSLADRMTERGLHGVVITEHDTLWQTDEIEQLNKGLDGIRIYRGIEVSSARGHFVVIGLDDLNGFKVGMPVESIISHAQRYGAAVILVHHHQVYPRTGMPVDVKALPDGIDAIEVASTATRGKNESEAKRWSVIRGWHPVGGSDAHCLENVGDVFTAFPELPPNEKALAAAIRSGGLSPRRYNET